jgi:hypothetical protein
MAEVNSHFGVSAILLIPIALSCSAQESVFDQGLRRVQGDMPRMACTELVSGFASLLEGEIPGRVPGPGQHP